MPSDELGEVSAPDNTPSSGSEVRKVSPFVAVLYVLAAGIAWAAMTPPGGVPDEPTHITYAAAVVRGDLGQIGDTGNPVLPRLPLVSVPAWVTSINVCFAFDPSVPADCQGPVSGEGEAVAPTTATWYPPAYYWVVGLPTLVLTEGPALYAMRATSAVLVTALIAAGLWAAAPWRRWWLALGVMMSFTPMVAHFSGSVNPSALEFGGVIGLSTALLGIAPEARETLTRRIAKRAWGQTAIVLMLAGLLAWARPWSVLVLGVVVVGPTILNYRALRDWIGTHRRPAAWFIGPAFILIVGAVLFELVLRGPVGREVAEHASGDALGGQAPLLDNVSAVMANAFAWVQQQVGLFGWLDHGAPAVVIAGWILLVGFLLLYALAVGKRSQRFVLSAMTLGATAIAPLFIIEFTMGSTKGYQARYHMAALLALVMVMTLVLGKQTSGAPPKALRTVTHWTGAFLPIAMILALLASLSRYAVAGSRGWHDLLFSPVVWLPSTRSLIVLVVSIMGLSALVPFTARLGLAAPIRPFDDAKPDSVGPDNPSGRETM